MLLGMYTIIALAFVSFLSLAFTKIELVLTTSSMYTRTMLGNQDSICCHCCQVARHSPPTQFIRPMALAMANKEPLLQSTFVPNSGVQYYQWYLRRGSTLEIVSISIALLEEVEFVFVSGIDDVRRVQQSNRSRNLHEVNI